MSRRLVERPNVTRGWMCFSCLAMAVIYCVVGSAPARAQTLWVMAARTNQQNPKLKLRDVAIPLSTDTIDHTIPIKQIGSITPFGESSPLIQAPSIDINGQSVKLGGIAVDRVAGGFWVTNGSPDWTVNSNPAHLFAFKPILDPTYDCATMLPEETIITDDWPQGMPNREILGLALDTVHGMDCKGGPKFLWMLTYQKDASWQFDCRRNVVTYVNLNSDEPQNIRNVYILDRWPPGPDSADEIPFVDIAMDPTLANFNSPENTINIEDDETARPFAGLWAIDADGFIEAFEIQPPEYMDTTSPIMEIEKIGGCGPGEETYRAVTYVSMGKFQIQGIPKGVKFEGIALDTSQPLELDNAIGSSVPLMRDCITVPAPTCDDPNPTQEILDCDGDEVEDCVCNPCSEEFVVGSETIIGWRYAGGTPIGLGTDGKAYPLLGVSFQDPVVPWEVDTGGPNVCYLGLTYSAEPVRIGSPCGSCGPGGPGGLTPPRPNIDIQWPQPSYPTPCIPVQYPPVAGIPSCEDHQAQPLVFLDFVVYDGLCQCDYDDPPPAGCLQHASRNFFLTNQIVVSMCDDEGLQGSTSTWLVRSRAFNSAGGSCPLYPDINAPAPDVIKTQLCNGLTQCTATTLPIRVTDWQDFTSNVTTCLPLPVPQAGRRFVEYVQWVYICDGKPGDNNFNLTGNVVLSDAFRMPWSNR